MYDDRITISKDVFESLEIFREYDDKYLYYFDKIDRWYCTRFKEAKRILVSSDFQTRKRFYLLDQLAKFGLDDNLLPSYKKYLLLDIAQLDGAQHLSYHQTSTFLLSKDNVLKKEKSIRKRTKDFLASGFNTNDIPGFTFGNIYDILNLDSDYRFEFLKNLNNAMPFYENTALNNISKKDYVKLAENVESGVVEMADIIKKSFYPDSEKKLSSYQKEILKSLDQKKLQEDDLIAIVLAHIVGHETTLRVAVFFLKKTLESKNSKFQELKQNKALQERFLHEFLRMYPPFDYVYRVAKKDITIGGKLIKEGQEVFIPLSVVNRDQKVFPNPEEFSLERSNYKSHISFAYGLHRCTGEKIAMMELGYILSLYLDQDI